MGIGLYLSINVALAGIFCLSFYVTFMTPLFIREPVAESLIHVTSTSDLQTHLSFNEPIWASSLVISDSLGTEYAVTDENNLLTGRIGTDFTITPLKIPAPGAVYNISISARSITGKSATLTRDIKVVTPPDLTDLSRVNQQDSSRIILTHNSVIENIFDIKVAATGLSGGIDSAIDGNELIVDVAGVQDDINLEIYYSLAGSTALTADSYLLDLTVAKDTEPRVLQILPSGDYVDPQTVIELLFSQTVDKIQVESDLEVSPNFSYKTSWEGDTRLVISPTSALRTDTTYTISISELNSNGSTYDTDISHAFKTAGVLEILNYTPSDESIVDTQEFNISIEFSQPVSRESAQENFSISPSIGGARFVWFGNTMSYRVNSVPRDVTYSIRLDKGIEPLFGKPSVTALAFKIYTETGIQNIDLPWYPAENNADSCLSATRMMLSTSDINLSESEIYAELPKESSPDDGFVDDYGIHDIALTDYFTSKEIEANQLRRSLLDEIQVMIDENKPVLVMLYDEDTLPQGTFQLGDATGYRGLMCAAVYGYQIDSSNELEWIYIKSPIKGHIRYTPEYFLGLWDYTSRQSLVISPPDD